MTTPVDEGWLRLKGLLGERHPQEIENLRLAYFAGAKHVFECLVIIVDEGDDLPTDQDMAKVEAIGKELEDFAHDFAINQEPGGHA